MYPINLGKLLFIILQLLLLSYFLSSLLWDFNTHILHLLTIPLCLILTTGIPALRKLALYTFALCIGLWESPVLAPVFITRPPDPTRRLGAGRLDAESAGQAC